MSILSAPFGKNKSSLRNDIDKAYVWICSALESSGYQIDETIESLKEIDRFFKDQVYNGVPNPNGLLAKRLGQRLFAIGCYVGNILIEAYGGEWLVDEKNPKGEINIAIKLKDGSTVFPVQRVMKRFKGGEEEGIYIYGIALGQRK